MFTKGLKKTVAVVLSATLMLASSMTVFAADPSTTAGTGNILDYKIQTQVVPTALKVAINPNGYKVNVRYHKVADDAAFDASKKYYKLVGDDYSVDTSITSDNWSTKKATAYVADEVTSQIVTFNYGLANKSTVDRKIKVSLAVAADDAIEFVSTAAEAANEAVADDGGAKKGEHKMFLQLVPAKAGAELTTNTYAKASEYAANTQYYSRNASNVYSEVEIANEDAFKGYDGTLYVETTTIGTEILASELGDVTMTQSTAPVAFAAGSGSTSVDVAYSLPKATYALKADQFIDFDTETEGLGDKFEMTGIGGLAGFTITGAMNTNTEWSTLDNTVITITPTYKFEDATGLETAVATGLNQIEAEPSTYTVTYKANYTADPVVADITETVNVGSKATGKVDGEDVSFTREGYTFAGWFDAAENGDEVTITNISSATTVFAHWTENPTDDYVMTASNGGYTYTFVDEPEGTLTAANIDGTARNGAVTQGNIAYSNGVLTINTTAASGFGLTSGNHTVKVTIGDVEYTLTISNS